MKRIGDLTIPAAASLYAQVPADRLGQYQAFRQDFPFKELIFEGVTWRYRSGGQGDPPLLLLSGALAVPDISWGTIASLATHRRVIAPEYPPASTMDLLADGIAAILRSEGIEMVDVVGGSYGGFVAQVFVRRYPQMTRALVLSHTQPPNPEMAVQMRRSARMLRWMPMGLVRKAMRRVFQSMMPERSDETACLLAIFDELIGHALEKKDAIAILERMVDFSAKPFSPQDLAGWAGKVLLIFGEDDPATPPDVRQRLESLYPGCQVRLFEGSGHATSVTHQEAYLSAINGFLAS